MEKVRKRNWTMILYPEDTAHQNAMEVLKNGGYKFCSILHDADTWQAEDADLGDHEPGSTKKEHWHVVLKFPQARWNTAIAQELGIKENYLLPCANLDGALLYLVHAAHPQKHQYDAEQAFGSLVPALNKLLVDDDEGMRVLEIVKEIDAAPGRVTYRDMLVKACNNGLYGEFRRLGSGVKWLIDEHNEEFYRECYGAECEDLRRDRFAQSVARPKDWVDKCRAAEKLGTVSPME